MAETKPITTRNPTNSALAKGVNALHECLEGARNDIDRIDRRAQLTADAVNRLEGAIDMISKGFGLPTAAQIAEHGPPAEVKPKLSGARLSRWQFMGLLASILAGLPAAQLLLRWIASIAPGVLHTILTVN